MYKTFYKNNSIYNNDAIWNLYNNKSVIINSVPQKQTIKVTQLPPMNPNVYNMLHNLLQTQCDIVYTEYYIPKASGGKRLITAPSEELKSIQKELNDLFIRAGATAHNNAYAYTLNRSCKDALIVHQANNSRWFYKFDLKNFFPSITEDILKRTLTQVYPFNSLTDDDWTNLFRLAMYNGGLPQGSPLSPLLSNMIMTGFDYNMQYAIAHFQGAYTRYADDILISLKYKKDITFLEHIIKRHLHNEVGAIKLNTDKSRCGSINGSNWNLGLILNKDNKITIGHKRKQQLKAKLNNFLKDLTEHKVWSIIDTQILQGELNYWIQIEPEYAEYCIQKLCNTWHLTRPLQAIFREIISGDMA